MTRNEMLQMLLWGQKLGLADRLPKDPIELQQLADQLVAESVYSEALPGGPVTGKQQLVLIALFSDSEKELELLPMYLEGPEWSAIFHDELRCSYVDADLPIEQWRAEQKAYFHQSLPDYPLLARIWDSYVDVEYSADEVSDLRAECSKLSGKLNNLIALSGLQKLMDASDQAVKKGMGLSLLAD